MSIRFAEMHTIFHLAGWIQSRFYLLSFIYYFPLTTFWQGHKDLKSKPLLPKISTYFQKLIYLHFSNEIHPLSLFLHRNPPTRRQILGWGNLQWAEGRRKVKTIFLAKQKKIQPKDNVSTRVIIIDPAPYMYNHIWPSQLCEDIGDDLNTHHLCETSGAPNVLLSGSVASTSTGIFRLRKSRLRSLRNRWFWSGWWLEVSSK